MKKKKVLLLGVLVLLAIFAWPRISMIKTYLGQYEKLQNQSDLKLYIKESWDEKQVATSLVEKGCLKDDEKFLVLAELKNYGGDVIKPGRYTIEKGMSYKRLFDQLRYGNGLEYVRLTFNNVKTLEDLAGRVGSSIEADSLDLIRLFKSDSVHSHYGFDQITFATLFLPDTYEFRWNTSAEEFLSRMADEYKKFWKSRDRIDRAKFLGMSQSEVVTLASIVQAEQSRRVDEQPKIAGLYINRLRKGMRLQSDPTLVFALGKSVRRVLNKHKKIKSPYNTYMNNGLPPGPINMPEKGAIDAVLYYDNHQYIFMCAKPEYSGYHNFAKTNAQHEVYASRYRKWLNRQGIMR